MTKRKFFFAATLLAGGISLVNAQLPDVGTAVSPSSKEQEALAALKGKVTGAIVWSTSRVAGKHDLWIMNADGTNQRPLTKGGNVDWFPRFSASGSQVVFTRSKVGWVSEMDAEFNDKWDIYTVNTDGQTRKGPPKTPPGPRGAPMRKQSYSRAEERCIRKTSTPKRKR